MIKNLNQLRRTLREGTQLEILDHCRPECIGQIRNITLVNTQGFYSTVANQPDASDNRGNGGRGPILWWGRAAHWQFTDGVCSVFDSEQKHLSQENMDIGKPVTSEKPVLFLESIYTFGLNDIEKEEVMKLAVSLTTQKAAELGVVSVLARRYLGCYERDEYVLAPFYVYISKSKNGWQYLDSLGGAAYTSAKEEYVEHPFLVMQTAMHHAEANSRNEVEYE